MKKPITDRELIEAFHPTPAVGGFPKRESLNILSSIEPFQRGWYASPVGWISANETHLVVAIRSLLLNESTLHLFAGAGIVADSIAKKEWEEIDHKMRILLYGCGLT